MPSLPGCCTYLPADLPLQAMDETSQHIKVSRYPLPKIPQRSYTDGVRLRAFHKLTCSSYTPGLSSLHGSDTSGGPSSFPSQRDPLHYKTQPRQLRWPSHLKSPPWSLDVSQCLVPHISCSPTSASFQALHFTGLPGRCAPTCPPPALSDAGVREHLMACMVEEPLTGQVSLDLNALFLLRSGTQICPLPSDCAYTVASI